MRTSAALMPKKPVGNLFLERLNTQPNLFESNVGTLQDIDRSALANGQPQTLFATDHGTLHVGDSLRWLSRLDSESVDLVFADPPYSIGKAEWDTFGSHEEYLAWSTEWLGLAARCLKPTGSLYVCGFSEILADIKYRAQGLFHSCRWLVWHYRNKANMANDWGRSHESLVHFRKSKNVIFNVDDVRVPYGGHTLRYPLHPQAVSSQYGGGKKRNDQWTPHPRGAKPRDVLEIAVTSNGMPEKTPHPTQKPEELLRKIILASSAPKALVVDPFAGSGTTLVCAEQLDRNWLGCELSETYCEWAIARLRSVVRRTTDEWLQFDREQASRRESIR
jgi:site-specific DNA-methyltransferase (adenine-specific)